MSCTWFQTFDQRNPHLRGTEKSPGPPRRRPGSWRVGSCDTQGTWAASRMSDFLGWMLVNIMENVGSVMVFSDGLQHVMERKCYHVMFFSCWLCWKMFNDMFSPMFTMAGAWWYHPKLEGFMAMDSPWWHINHIIGVSINMEKPIKCMRTGVPLFRESSIWGAMSSVFKRWDNHWYF